MKLKMKIIIILSLSPCCFKVFGGLPPTTSKISGDASNKTTFNYQFPGFGGTHTGTTLAVSNDFTARLTAPSFGATGTAGAGYLTLIGQSSNPTSPSAGTLLLHSKTVNGFTRLEQDNESTTNLVYGRDNAFIAKNETGATILKGRAVYTSGTVSGVPQISLARSNSNSTVPALGVAVDDIPHLSFGQVMTKGVLTFDTTAFSDGQTVWVSPTTAGTLTATRPSGTTNNVQRMGTILVSGVSGSMLVDTAPAVLNMETGTNAATWTGKAIAGDSIAVASTSAASTPCPPMTTSQRVALTPTEGQCVYDSTTKTLFTYNGTIWISSVGSIQLDNVYSANVSAAGVISNLNKAGWLSGNCSVSGTSLFDCPVLSGLVTQKLNCNATIDYGAFAANYLANYDTATSSTSNLRFSTQNSNNGAATAKGFTINCQKSGVDYTNASAAVYSGASANYSYTNGGAITITAVTTNPTKGTTTTDRVFHQRNGQNLNAIYQYAQTVAGSAGSGNYLYAIPNSLSMDTNIITPYTGSIFSATSQDLARSYVGEGTISFDTGLGNCKLYAYSATQFRAWCVYGTAAAGSTSSNVDGSTFGALSSNIAGKNFNVNAPIAGWSNVSQVMANIAGYGKAPGIDVTSTPNLDTFSVAFSGSASIITVCASSTTCTLRNQIGNSVSSIVASAGSIYTINFSRTYSIVNCSLSATVGVNVPAGLTNYNLSCSNCASMPFGLKRPQTELSIDSFGTLMCQGIY